MYPTNVNQKFLKIEKHKPLFCRLTEIWQQPLWSLAANIRRAVGWWCSHYMNLDHHDHDRRRQTLPPPPLRWFDCVKLKVTFVWRRRWTWRGNVSLYGRKEKPSSRIFSFNRKLQCMIFLSDQKFLYSRYRILWGQNSHNSHNIR